MLVVVHVKCATLPEGLSISVVGCIKLHELVGQAHVTPLHCFLTCILQIFADTPVANAGVSQIINFTLRFFEFVKQVGAVAKSFFVFWNFNARIHATGFFMFIGMV